MTTGEQLKGVLGLDNVSARITRIISFPLKLYYVWYDSARPTFPLSWSRIKGSKQVSQMTDGAGYELSMTPLINIESYNGDYKSAYFVLVDLAGQRMINPKLFEAVTIDDLKGASSEFTKKFRKDRNKSTGTENRVSKLIQVDYRSKNLMFKWLTIPTDSQEFPNRDIYNAAPESGELSLDKSKTYEMDIEILDFDQWLDTYPEGSEIKAKDIKDILEVAYVKVWCSSPAFHWQGMAFRLTKLDGAIYPVDIPDSYWKNFHGKEGLLDKHLLGLINALPFWANPMASMATKFLKTKGLLK